MGPRPPPPPPLMLRRPEPGGLLRVIWRLALPRCTWLTWLAKRRLQTLSFADAAVGERLTNMSAFPSPDKQSYRTIAYTHVRERKARFLCICIHAHNGTMRRETKLSETSAAGQCER